MKFLIPVLIFLGFGLLFGVLLVVISKVFAVKVDTRVESITEALPHANCGACGYAGCADYADAIVNKGAPMNACLPGGGAVATKIGEIMGVSVSASDRAVPVLHCNGTCHATQKKFEFDGIQTCTSVKRFYGGNGVCQYGCIGLGDCQAVCEHDVISFRDGLPQFCLDRCISCNKCATTCPQGLIELRSEKMKIDVHCSSRDIAKTAMKVCQNSCIGCGKCEKTCKFDAIHVENAFAIIDYTKCKNCGMCAKVCPKQCITNLCNKISTNQE